MISQLPGETGMCKATLLPPGTIVMLFRTVGYGGLSIHSSLSDGPVRSQLQRIGHSDIHRNVPVLWDIPRKAARI